MYPVTCEFLHDVRVHGLGIGNVNIAFRNGTVALLGKAPSVQRRREPRIELQRGVEIGDRVLVLPALEVERPRLSSASTKFGRSRSASLQSRKRRLQIADHGTSPAAVIVGLYVLRIESRIVSSKSLMASL